MLALERLSPLERAAFLLHDVFEMDFAEVAGVLRRSEAACRQLAARARGHVQAAKPRFPVAREDGERFAAAFLQASRDGDESALKRLLADGAVLHSDGGGIKKAALNPILGGDRIARFFAGIAGKIPQEGPRWARFCSINGLPGYVSLELDGTLQTVALEIDGDRIAAVYVVRNPEKLGRMQTLLAT
jgi:RNA polymerase sigma-70 factor (ECF subfamily)